MRLSRYSSLVDAIGHTPLVEVSRFCPNPAFICYVKLEGLNPTGSVKDRVALYLIDALESAGRLTPESIILEPTSGNTGISLAMICRVRGWPLTVVMPANVTRERRQLLEIYGATIINSPAELGSNGAVAWPARWRPTTRDSCWPTSTPTREPAGALRDDCTRDHRRLPRDRCVCRRTRDRWNADGGGSAAARISGGREGLRSGTYARGAGPGVALVG